MNSVERRMAILSNINYEARDEGLLLAARSGSHAAFAELQRIYSPYVFKRILSITRNREDAEDALQDAFLRAYLALPSFEGRSRFSSWLTRIGINSALMILRRRRCRPETPFEQHQNSEGDSAYLDVRDRAFDPEQLYDQQQRCDAIRCALQRLDPKSREVMGFRLSEEHTMQKIAQDLGVSVASVKARLHRARKRLLRSAALGTRREVDSSGGIGARVYSSSRQLGQRSSDSTVGLAGGANPLGKRGDLRRP
jgi:RNA polymerase sigma-70 factor (ECF subfamily)